MDMHFLKSDKLPNLLSAAKKEIYQKFKLSRPDRISILFILGCQRSGTTLLTRIFENDLDMKVYGEFSSLSSQDKSRGIRLNPPAVLRKDLERNKTPGIVLKPLVESQNAPALLDYFAHSKALWVFRHYKDVAGSSVRRFGEGNGINNLKTIVDRIPNNWRSEGVSDETEKLVRSLFSDSMDPYDAAALFWVVRNRFYYDLGLHLNPRVMLSKYEDLVHSPSDIITKIYEFMDCRYPGERIIRDVYDGSVGKGKAIKLSPEIDSLCGELLLRLEETYQAGILWRFHGGKN